MDTAILVIRLISEIVGASVLLLAAYLLTVYTVHKYGKRVGIFLFDDYAELMRLIVIWRDPWTNPFTKEKQTIQELKQATDWKSIKLFGVTFMWVSRNVRK
jgi:hypothetical protein